MERRGRRRIGRRGPASRRLRPACAGDRCMTGRGGRQAVVEVSGRGAAAHGRPDPYRIIHGDCATMMRRMRANSVNCIITSPPYWNQREYDIEPGMQEFAIGSEPTPDEYVERLRSVFSEAMRVLAPDGSLWLNMGDKYVNKDLVGLPWMTALGLKRDGWILRSDILWNKMKGPQNSRDRVKSVHEYIFHFVKSKSYYFDRSAILHKPQSVPTTVNGKLTSNTGVSGTRYRRCIAESADLTAGEKRRANAALDSVIGEMRDGKIVDFRMVIRGRRVSHSDKGSVSGRARELDENGFFFLRAGASGTMPTTIWNVVPEDAWRTDDHYAPFPVDLLHIPIKSTCVRGGVVMDPFCGTGSAVLAAVRLGRRGIGIELGSKYASLAEDRLRSSLDGNGIP